MYHVLVIIYSSYSHALSHVELLFLLLGIFRNEWKAASLTTLQKFKLQHVPLSWQRKQVIIICIYSNLLSVSTTFQLSCFHYMLTLYTMYLLIHCIESILFFRTILLKALSFHNLILHCRSLFHSFLLHRLLHHDCLISQKHFLSGILKEVFCL